MKRYRVFQPVALDAAEVMLLTEHESQNEAEAVMASVASSFIECVDGCFSIKIEDPDGQPALA